MYIEEYNCSGCEEDKPLDMFYPADTVRGHTTVCKVCTIEVSRVNKLKKKKYEYDNVFRGDPFPKPKTIRPYKRAL